MARVVQALPEGTLTMPVLSSPELAVMQARDVLASRQCMLAAAANGEATR